MDSLNLRDEAARNRVRQAEEFLDPRTFGTLVVVNSIGLEPAQANILFLTIQMTNMCEAIDQTSS